jgi:rubrerythrin
MEPISSQAWWQQVKHDPEAFRGWLLDQFRGESAAAGRIELLRDTYASENERAHKVLSVIAEQERKHARWVGALLRARGILPEVQSKAERYWPHVLTGIADLATGCAVGAHAEQMRLERIETIAADREAPDDVRQTFARIVREERFHERAFRHLAGPTALEVTRESHRLGRIALGLLP